MVMFIYLVLLLKIVIFCLSIVIIKVFIMFLWVFFGLILYFFMILWVSFTVYWTIFLRIHNSWALVFFAVSIFFWSFGVHRLMMFFNSRIYFFFLDFRPIFIRFTKRRIFNLTLFNIKFFIFQNINFALLKSFIQLQIFVNNQLMIININPTNSIRRIEL